MWTAGNSRTLIRTVGNEIPYIADMLYLFNFSQRNKRLRVTRNLRPRGSFVTGDTRRCARARIPLLLLLFAEPRVARKLDCEELRTIAFRRSDTFDDAIVGERQTAGVQLPDIRRNSRGQKRKTSDSSRFAVRCRGTWSFLESKTKFSWIDLRRRRYNCETSWDFLTWRYFNPRLGIEAR